jgi:hypothetical protein
MKKKLILAMVLVLAVGSIAYAIEYPTETSVMGILHDYSDTGFGLRLDTLLYIAKGSKSEGSTDFVKLRVPAELLKKAEKLKGKHVVVTGLLNCDGDWPRIFCDMTVKQIE